MNPPSRGGGFIMTASGDVTLQREADEVRRLDVTPKA
jgi:hypothetical protein